MKALALLLTTSALFGQVRLPEYTRDVLPNGTVIDVMPRRGVPLVSLQVAIKGGVESDPAAAGGLAAVTADLLRRGTRSRTADQFSEQLDFMGATYSTRVTPQATLVTAQFLAKDLEPGTALIADAVLRPTFPETEVKKALAERIERSKAIKDEPMLATASYFQAFFFGSAHPYGHRADGDEITLAHITRADVTGYHDRMYGGRNLIVAAAGDFDASAVRATLAKAFGEARPGTAYTWRQDTEIPETRAPRLFLVDKPGAAQTYFWIGNPGITRTHPDRVAVWLVNTLFGGRFTSMLNDELRVNSGLTYGASSRVDEDRLTGRIALLTYTRTEESVRAIDMALDVLRRLREKGITAEQLASAKAYLEGTFPPDRLETSDQLASVLAEIELFGLTRADIDGLFARIDAVTLEQANAAARKYFGSGGLVFAVVGDAAKIRSGVQKYAPSMIETRIGRPGFGVPDSAPARVEPR